MAKDTKTINVHPDNEVPAINFFRNFGWELFSNQEVKTSSSHLKESMWTDDIVQVTRTEHYIKLTFQRDTSIPNYSRLTRLEDEYNAVKSPEKPRKLGWGITIALTVFLVFMLVFAIGSRGDAPVLAIPMAVIGLAAVIGVRVKRIQSYRKRLDEYNDAERVEVEKKQKILSECQELIS